MTEPLTTLFFALIYCAFACIKLVKMPKTAGSILLFQPFYFPAFSYFEVFIRIDMKQKQSFFRPLNDIEQAFTISNDAAPLSVVCVLHLSPGPATEDLRAALDRLQGRHPLLRAGIGRSKGRFYFQKLAPAPPLPLSLVFRQDEASWRTVTEEALNTTFDRSGPLLKCWHVTGPDTGESEVIVGFHHAIVDGIAARLLLHELLSLAGKVALPEPLDRPVYPRFPPSFRKVRLAPRLLAFAGRQLADEWRYRQKGIGAPVPAHSHNAILSFRLSPALSRQLTLRAGREGLSLNSVLLAAIAHAVFRRRYGNREERPARLISFADLRPALVPPVSGQQLGCHISMLRFSVLLSERQSLPELARQVRKAHFTAGRRGETFLMALASRHLMRMVLRIQRMRLGLAALSFIGKLELEPAYGALRLHDVKAFITNNRFGPEFSAFGKVLFGSIGLDFTFLTAEMKAEEAEMIVKEIRRTLEKMAE